jgi:hypothetical protein
MRSQDRAERLLVPNRTRRSALTRLRAFADPACGRQASSKPRHLDASLLSLCAIFLLAVAAPSAASASFARPVLRSITESASGPFIKLGGVTVDGEDNLWAGDGSPPSALLDEFGPGFASPPNAPVSSLATVAETEPASLAVEQATGNIFLTGTIFESINPRVEVFNPKGELLAQWLKFGDSAHVAIDNSTNPLDPSACKLANCTVYVAHTEPNPEAPRGDEEAPGIERFEVDDAGQPQAAPFTATESYIEGNEIVGVPAGTEVCTTSRFTPNTKATVTDLTVDSEGNIYAIDPLCEPQSPDILEYRPSGEFVRVINGKGSPGLMGNALGGWGGDSAQLELTGVAVDAATDRLFVSLDLSFHEDEKRGAVDEFDLATGAFVGQITDGVEERPLEEPAAVAADSHDDVYVADHRRNAVEVFGPGQLLPNLRIAEASERTPTSAVLNGAVEPEGLAVTSCRFQYVTEAAFNLNVAEHGGRVSEGFADLAEGGEAPCTPAAGAIEPNHQFQQVHAQVTGLSSGTLYRYRLVARTEEPAGGAATTGALAFTAQAPSVVLGESSGNVSSAFAELHAEIHVLGAPTSYHFEYDTTPFVGTSEHGVSVPVPAAAIGSGGSTGTAVDKVTQNLSGLSEGTTYHFRVVAESLVGGKAEAAFGADETFTTTPLTAPGLPDGRAYELITPPNKGSAEDMFANDRSLGAEPGTKDRGYPAESGNGFLLETRASFGPFPGSGRSVYAFVRGAAGWTYKSLASPERGLQAIETPAFAPWDFSEVALVDQTGASASVGGRRAIVLEGPPGGQYTQLYEGQPTNGGLQDPEHTKIGTSQDFSHIVLDSRSHSICAGAEGQDEGSHSVCEYSPATGELRLADVDDAGQPLGRCGAQLGRDTEVLGSAHNAVSDARMFFTAPDPEMKAEQTTATQGCWNRETGEDPPQIYARSGRVTVNVSVPLPDVREEGRLPVQQPAAYIGASVDGSKMFFVSKEELTKDDEGIHDLELYEWESDGSGSCDSTSTDYNVASNGCLSRISHGETGHAVADLRAVRAISSDGSAVYFTSRSQLTADAPPATAEFGSEELNLYRYDTNLGLTTYVATVLEVEEPDENSGDWLEWLAGLTDGRNFAPENATNWDTSPDGDYLVFPSTRELTGYHTAGCQGLVLPDTQGSADGHCEELYRYDVTAPSGGSLTCLSCNPSNAAPVGNAEIARSYPFESATAGPVSAISTDGSLAFFDTRDALVPQDTNGTLDVYEWESDGRGGCTLVSGCVHLISSGNDSQPSLFLGASPDGADVFFGTHARLVSSDTDTAGDLYDARICAAADPCVQPPAAETAQCQGDSCQTAPPAPANASLGSLSFSGAENLAPSPPTPAAKPKAKPLTRAQKLAKALKACRRKQKRKRTQCERQARKHFAPAKKKGKR